MKKRSGRIITLLAALSTAAALSISTFAGVPDTKSDLIIRAAQTQERNLGNHFIRILSPSDGDVFYQGQDISYRVNVTGSYPDYTTRPYITFVSEINEHIKGFTFPEDLASGERGTFTGKIETESKIEIDGKIETKRLDPGTYYFGVINWPSKDGVKLKEEEIVANKLEPPLLAIEIEVRAHETHSWDSGNVTKPATCTEAGEKVFKCTLCEKTRTEEIPATGHTWDTGVVTTPPDVGKAGVITYTCTTCKATKTEEAAPKKATIQKTPASVKVKAGKKGSVIVSWNKIKNSKKNKKLLKQIKSIEVQYSTDPTFQENSKVKTYGKKKTEVSLKLKRKTTYYFRVRYVGNGGASYWSKTKRARTR